jgi:prepilin-type N-terminal cleavage/methylation domain-containing protein
MKTNKAFTLIELMITVAIIGILASVALPTFSKYKDRVLDAEANMTLGAMANGMKSYFDEEWVVDASLTSESWTHCFPSGGAAPPNVNGGGEIGSMIPNALPGQKQFVDFGAYQSFSQIGLSGSGYYYHTYILGSGGGCASGPIARGSYLSPVMAIRITKFNGPADAALTIGAMQLYYNEGVTTNGGIIWYHDMAIADFLTALTGLLSGTTIH